MDAGYGNDTSLRTEITAIGMSYVAGIGPNTSVWSPGAAPLPPRARSGRGRPQKRLQRDGQHQPISVKALALRLPEKHGKRSPGVREPQIGSRRALPGGECGRRIVITC